jgi:hypothetical protein
VLRVDVVADAIEVVHAPSEYHWYEYGAVPPDGLALRAIDWPVSIAGALGDIPPADNGPFTVTVTAFEVTTWDGEPLSLTCNSNDQAPVEDRTPVEVVGLSPTLQAKEVPRLP